MKIKQGSTSRIATVRILDSRSNTGAGLTGLVHNTAGLVAYYKADTAASATAITLATATVGTFTSGGFKEVDATNQPGLYEIGVPNAALASGNRVDVLIHGAANMVPARLSIELDAIDYAAGTVKLASDGLDAISTTAPTGPASNFRQMVVQVWRRFFKRTVLDESAGTLKTYADDGTTVVTTQTVARTSTSQTQGTAS